ncbi:MAG: site-specific integrase, partial [Chloroflexi bacterium]|nr:site-specific integrase [Chloroflexota bacterium]
MELHKRDHLIITSQPMDNALDRPASPMHQAGQAANRTAAQHVFEDYRSRKSDNTLHRHRADLARFAVFLAQAGLVAGDLLGDPAAWEGITWGIVEAFRNWMTQQGDAVNSINARLSTVKTYAKLAAKAGVISDQEHALIRTVSGYSSKEGRRIDERREQTRRGAKKAAAVRITDRQASALKSQPDTPQGRRDALLMCLLLDHGLRVGEVAGLKVSDLDLKAGVMTLYRPKVDLLQTHKLTADTLRAAHAYFDVRHVPEEPDAPLLCGSWKGGSLRDTGMSERAITQRVK